ncbi:MAG: biotin/lipoyl-binding protein [Prevotella sp.]|nr:biotin/lipoyl-binding protein [Prevotella sp.]
MEKYKYTINGNKYDITVNGIENNIASVVVNGEEFKVEIEREPEPAKKEKVHVTPAKPVAAKPVVASSPTSKPSSNNAVLAPLPGVIKEIKVVVGDVVKIGDTVVILEAMKMANNLDTEIAGTVKEILVQEGESVMESTPLVIIE